MITKTIAKLSRIVDFEKIAYYFKLLYIITLYGIAISFLFTSLFKFIQNSDAYKGMQNFHKNSFKNTKTLPEFLSIFLTINSSLSQLGTNWRST